MGVDTGGAGDQGIDVRLRLRRDARADAHADPTRAPAHAQAARSSQEGRSSISCGPTANPRSRSNISMAAPLRVDTVVISTQHSEKVSQRDLARRGHRRSDQARDSRRDGRQENQISTSIPPAASSPAARWAMRASPAARSSSTPTAATAVTAAARFPAKIHRRSTARLATWRVTLRRISSRLALPRKVEVQLAYAIGVAEPVSVMADTFGTGTIPECADHRTDSRILQAHAQGHHRNARSAPPDLSSDGRLRPFRPHRPGLHLGANGQSRRHPQGSRHRAAP